MKPSPGNAPSALGRLVAVAALTAALFLAAANSAVRAGCPEYTIAASAKVGGTIDPAGAVTVSCQQTFTITPDACYDIAAVIVDGGSVGAVTEYTFFGITEDHTIHAEFVLKSFDIVASAHVGGLIAPPGTTAIACGGTAVYTITPGRDHAVADVLVDGASVGAVTEYTFDDVQARHTLVAVFAPRLSIGDVRQAEGNAGSASFSFPVIAPATAFLPASASFTTVGGTATVADGDFASAGGTVSVNPVSPAFDFEWGGLGTAAGRLNAAYGVAVDDDGFVYVTDFGNNRIQKFTPDGSYVTQWGTPGGGPGQFSLPTGIAADHGGHVYVMDTNNGRVQKFTTGGVYVLEWGDPGSGPGQFSTALGLAVDLDGFVYVADQFNNRVQKFTSDGTYVGEWDGSGGSDGTFDGPRDVAVDERGSVFVTDFNNKRVKRFDTQGTLLNAWSVPGASSPGGVTCSGTGAVFVTDLTLNRVLAYDPSGTLLHQWGAFGINPGQFNQPASITVSHEGRFYVTDRGNHRVQSFVPVPANATVAVSVAGDTKVEAHETFEVALSSPVNAAFRKGTATGFALNDDVEVGVADAGAVEGAAGSLGVPFGVTLSGPNPIPVSVHVQTEDGAATVAGNDYFAASADLVIPTLPPAYALQWGGQGSATGQFESPTGVAIDATGHVYVADLSNHRIQKFDAAGAFVLEWGGLGFDPGQFQRPAGVAVDAFGYVYVADHDNHRIQKFEDDGTFVAQWGSSGNGPGEFLFPYAIDVSPEGRVYVVDHGNHRVQSFRRDGAFIDEWGALGSGAAEFNFPTGIAVDGNAVYVSDTGNDRVQKFDLDGSYLAEWGGSGSGEGQFEAPYSVTIHLGSIYVADGGNDRVQKFDPGLGFVSEWGTTGGGDGQFQQPRDVAVDGGGNLYVVEALGHRVQKFAPVTPPPAALIVDVRGDTQVEPHEDFGVVLSSPLGATLGRARALGIIRNDDAVVSIAAAAADEGNAGSAGLSFSVSVSGVTCEPVSVHYESSDGGATLANDDYESASGDLALPSPAPAFQLAFGTSGSGNTQFDEPLGVAVDRAGNVYVADRFNHRVQKFDASGAYLGQWGSLGTAPGRFDEPHGIAVDGDHVYVTDAGNQRVQKFTTAGAFVVQWGSAGAGPGQFAGPFGVAVDALGNVYVADRFNHRIQKFSREGMFLLAWGAGPGAAPGQFDGPIGVAVNAFGNVLVTDFANDRVQEFDAFGTFVRQFGTTGNAAGQLDGPFGIASGRCGETYVSDRGNHRVQRFDGSGTFVSQFGTGGNGNGQFSSPDGIGIAIDGTLYVADEGNDRIQKFTPAAPGGAVVVQVNGDTTVEPDETFDVTLTSPVGATLGTTLAAGTIRNDDVDSGPVNLCLNPGFESNIAGWTKYADAKLARVSGGRNGSLGALQVRSDDDDEFGVDDQPNWVGQVAAKGAVYRFSAYVRSDLARGKVRLRVYELLGSSQKGSASTPEVTLGMGWQLLTLDYTVRTPGTTLSMRIVNDPKKSKESFLVDDVSILLISSPPDRAPVVTAPANVTAAAGFPLSFTIGASDPDGQAIQTLAASGLPPGAGFTANGARTAGTFTWTPSAGQVSATPYEVAFTATNALSGSATTRITVTAAPPNLISNGGFESGIAGWTKYGSATLSWFHGGGHSGSKALQIASTSSSSFGCDDDPDAVPSASRNSVYRFKAWVRSASHTGKVKIRVYEFLNGSQQGSTVYSQEVPLSQDWKELTATHTVRENGSSLSMRVTDATGNQTFLVDDVSVVLVSGPAPALVATPADELGADPADALAADPAETRTGGVRAFAPDAAGLMTTAEPWAVRLEGVPAVIEAEVPQVVLRLAGREARAIASRTLVGEDRDGDGWEELWAWFDPAEARALFQAAAGRGAVEATVEARSGDASVVAAPLAIDLGGAPLAFTAAFGPNPARGEGALSFTLTRPGPARVDLYDAGGRQVRTLLEAGTLEAGAHRVPLPSRALEAGLYFYRLETMEGVRAGRFVYLK